MKYYKDLFGNLWRTTPRRKTCDVRGKDSIWYNRCGYKRYYNSINPTWKEISEGDVMLLLL